MTRVVGRPFVKAINNEQQSAVVKRLFDQRPDLGRLILFQPGFESKADRGELTGLAYDPLR